jgi:hypothetical protein
MNAREFTDPSRRPSMSRTILITGTGNGFGRDTAETNGDSRARPGEGS